MFNKKTFCIDIDNTICRTTNNFYKNSKPIKKNIKLINNLYKKGHTIIFFTARGMSKYKGNKKKIHKVYYEFTRDQLIFWGVKFHKLILCKPSYDIVIDDKSIFFKKNWTKEIDNLLKKL
jgi:hypothetical protein